MSIKTLKESHPRVATFWYLDDQKKFIGSDLDVSDATYFGDFGQCDDDHFKIWYKYRRINKIKNVEYDYYPRGRVMFNSKIHKFVVVCDKCIANNPDLRKALISEYDLPYTTIFDTDEHYTCHNCED